MPSEKYQTLRRRFLDHFYYQGRVAAHVAPDINGGEITFGDQTIYLGQALLAFSTEMAVARATSENDSDARSRIDQLLEAVEELERKANQRYGTGVERDGLFVRDDITGPDDTRLGGRFQVVSSDW